MEEITIPKSDKGFDLNFTITTSAGTAKNLTGYTIKLKTWKPGVSGTLLVDGSCDIDDAVAGTCRYAVAADDFATKGRYYAEVELTKTGIVESTETFIIAVVESG